MLTAGAGLPGPVLGQQLLGGIPAKMPVGRSVYRVRGDVKVDGLPATLDTVIEAGSTIVTRDKSRIIFVVGEHSYLVRSNSEMKIEGSGFVTRSLRLLTGSLLSVFGKTKPKLATNVATIGIRGTGVYMESEPDLSYVCTCYGLTEITANADPNATEQIRSEHHDAPRYILSTPSGGKLILPAPFKNHDDEELALLEALVGREPPFDVFGDGYGTTTEEY